MSNRHRPGRILRSGRWNRAHFGRNFTGTHPAPISGVHRPSITAGDLVRIREQRWQVTQCVAFEDASILSVTGRGPENNGISAQFLLPVEPIARLPASRAPRVVGPRTWRRIARHVLSSATPHVGSLRTAADADLTVFPFQLAPALAVTHALATRLLIADEVGLGKTIQAGLVIAERLSRFPEARALVVAPASLREQWQRELESRFHLRTSALDAAAVSRVVRGLPGTSPWDDAPVVITSIDYVKRPEVLRSLEPLVFDVLVLDEAHALSGASARSSAAASLACRSRVVVLLSATPH